MDPLTLAVGVGVTTIAGIGTGLRLRHRLRRAEADADRLRRELETERYAAHHDSLTGLPNRRAFYRLGSRLVTAPDRPPVSCVVVDLNAFKHVNDTFGHAAGDEVLITVARRLARYREAGGQCDSGALVARLGGDEFAGLFAYPTGRSSRCPAAEELAELLAAPMSVAGHNLRVTAAVGAAPIPPEGDGTPRGGLLDTGARWLLTALQQADSAMYRAKATGTPAAHFDPTLDGDGDPAHRPDGYPDRRQFSPRPAAPAPEITGALVAAACPGVRS